MKNKDPLEDKKILTLGNQFKINEKWMIIGYKFGIYGYLPSLINCGYNNIFINQQGKDYISNLPKLKHLTKHIETIKDYESKENIIKNIILAIPPCEQNIVIKSKLNLNQVKNLILEKPLAASPKEASILLDYLNYKKINYKINYSFLYTNWFPKTKEKVLGLGLDTCVTILWRFKAHHFVNNLNNWKRFHSLGGGALRFYGVHLIALLSDLGYEEVEKSIAYKMADDELYKWTCFIPQYKNLPNIKITVDSNSNENNFNISYIKYDIKKDILTTSNPFALENIINGYDNRVSPISKFIKDKRKINQKKIIKLWKEIEEKLIIN